MRMIAIPVWTTTWLLVWVPAALSADFTFNVPVDLETLSPSIKSYYTQCDVYDTDPDLASSKSIGTSGAAKVAIPAGQASVKTTATVSFSVAANSGYTPAQAKWFKCLLGLCLDTAQNTFANCKIAVLTGTPGPSTPPWSIAANNSSSVVSVKGQIPAK